MYLRWMDDDTGFKAPKIWFPSGLYWESHHALDDKATQVYGFLRFPGCQVELDVYTTADQDVTDDIADQARQAWESGSVLVTNLCVTSMILPVDAVTGPVLLEGFKRMFT